MRKPTRTKCPRHFHILLTSFVLVSAGAAGQNTQYLIGSTCAVGGSTVTLPCSFTPRNSFNKGDRELPLKIVRVLWCKNHKICHGETPSVYDSNSTTNDPRYEYLGDQQRNCTLQITRVNLSDNATFRFRMEADNNNGHFTNQTGVNVTVVGENNTPRSHSQQHRRVFTKNKESFSSRRDPDENKELQQRHRVQRWSVGLTAVQVGLLFLPPGDHLDERWPRPLRDRPRPTA